MSLRAPDALAVGERVGPPVISIDLCVECGLNPKAAQGRLSRCIPCIKAAAAEDRAARAAAEAALAEKRAKNTKLCRTCKRTKALADFSPHRLAKVGRRHDCKACVAAGRVKKRKALTEAQRQADRAARQTPHRRAANLASVLAWQARNGEALEAHRAVDRAVRAGEVVPTKACQAAGCKKRSGLVSHHNSYATNRRKRVVWLCRQHHRVVHAGRNVPLKRTAPVRFAKAPLTG